MNPFNDPIAYRWFGEDEKAYYGLKVGQKQIDYILKDGGLKGIKLTANGQWAVNAAVLMFESLNGKERKET